MFRLAEIEDTIRIEPANMEKDRVEALTEEINRKYSNRVLQEVGLCIFLFDFIKAGEGIVRWGDGCLYHHCTFRMMVFRPFPGEVLHGRIKSVDEEGIRITMDFFDDLYVPPHHMPNICAFDHHERAWFWIYQAPPDPETGEIPGRITDPYSTDRDERLYMHVGDQIRFAVEEDEFNDPEPGPSAVGGGTLAEGARIGGGAFAPPPPPSTAAPAAGSSGTAGAPGVGPASAQGGNVASAAGAAPGEVGTGPTLHADSEGVPVPAAYMDRVAPYIVVCSIAPQGLGLPGWWGDEHGAQAEDDAGMEDVNGYQDDEQGVQ